jgi:hypothetical protein
MADSCDLLEGTPAGKYCERGDGSHPSTGGGELGGFMDPLGSAANWMADQAAALYRQMDRLMAGPSGGPLSPSGQTKLHLVYNPIAGMSLLIGVIVLLGAVIFWMARPSGEAFRKTGRAGGRFLALLVLASAIPVLVLAVTGFLNTFTSALYTDIAGSPFKGMEHSLLGSDSDPYGRLAQALVALLSIGSVWLVCVLAPVVVVAAMVFLPLLAAFGIARGWMASPTIRRVLHAMGAAFLAKVPVTIVLMFRPVLPKGALTDLLLTASAGVACLYVLLAIPDMAQSTVGTITRMPKMRGRTDGTTKVTKMPAGRERQVHSKRLADSQASAACPPKAAQPEVGPKPQTTRKEATTATPPPVAETVKRYLTPATPASERSPRVRADVPPRPAVRDGDAQAPSVGH